MKRILSIDGGGIRGLIPALVLAEIEKRTGKKIAQLFDLIAGTSTGGILALGLTRSNGNNTPRFSASELADLYEARGNDIFSRSRWRAIHSLGGVSDEKYSHEGLEKVLAEYFEEEPLGSAVTDVLISAYDIQNREPYFFKSWRPEYATVEMRHVARATSAAPTYFEPALVGVGGATRALIDGGVFVNNPAMSAYAEARRMFKDKTLCVVSLGTGALIRSISHDEAKNWGKLEWAVPVLSVVFDGVSDAVDYQLDKILTKERFYRFQIDLTLAKDDMDDASRSNLEALKAEAKRLIRTHRDKLEAVCETLGKKGPARSRKTASRAPRRRKRARRQPAP